MTSVSPRGLSPHSMYDPNSDTEQWELLGYSSGSSSVGLVPSPSSGSLSGYAIIGHIGPSPETPVRSSGSPPSANMSPMFLGMDAAPMTSSYQGTPLYPDQGNMMALTSTSTPLDSGFAAATAGEQFLTPLMFTDDLTDLSYMDAFPHNTAFPGMIPFGTQSPVQQSPLMQHQPLQIHPSQQSPSPIAAHHGQNIGFNAFQLYPHGSPSRQWTPEIAPPPPAPAPAPIQAQSPIIIHESGYSSSPLLSSSCGSPYNSDSTSSDVKQEPDRQSPEAPLRKVKTGKVEKKGGSKFVIMTPNTITASAGRPNPYECFEAMRTTQRGRKGPLANDTKESALQVRRLGACFCCHSRKVRCDKERPCKNCKKLAATVPQVVCWQFQDFMTVLFPDFMRLHFKKDQMAKFMEENLANIEMHQILEIELYSGPSFASVLRLPARSFRPKNQRIMKHYHLFPGKEKVNILACNSAPLVLELDTNTQRDTLRKAAKDYVLALTKEPCYVSQTTDSIKHTDVPRRILEIVQEYANRSDSAMVKKALAIYGAHYVMTRHLCLTQESTAGLRLADVIPSNLTVMTPRVAARQIKAVVDELLAKDMQSLFESFSKSLKPKSKREWAPCLASFLVLCLFIEAVETAADNFVITCNEISMRERRPPEFRRDSALAVNREVENLPFKQFAYQFHQIYQTHSRDVSAKPYNPLIDDTQLDFSGTDDPAAALNMTHQLRDMIRGEKWSELDFLTMDPILPEGNEAHPFPRNVSLTYTGRLVSRFLLSFTDEKYIWGRTFS